MTAVAMLASWLPARRAAAVAMLASWLPARRAAAVDPVVAIRG